ncbi:MAG: hypothetical protein ABR567_02360 [Myxococcales bacterium]
MKPFLLLLLLGCLREEPTPLLRRIAGPQVTVITDVSVVDPGSGEIRAHQDVVVRGGSRSTRTCGAMCTGRC